MSKRTQLHKLADLGTSIWIDHIRRSFIESGELEDWIDKGLLGITSNPSIFKKAIAGSTDYDEELHRLVEEGRSTEEIYEALVLSDIGRAADLLRPIHDRTEGTDGYVSLEVSPGLAHDTEGTIREVRHLFGALDRPNVMIKVPATPEGIPAIERLVAEGININVTLMFSLDQYEAVSRAYLSGLERLEEAGGDLSRVASVASFFVSRVDSAVDLLLEERGATELLGKIALANAKMAYARSRETYRGERWERLSSAGARVQRLLWGSTSTKNPAYPDTLYIDQLIGPEIVNTVPPKTLRAFLDHGRVARTIDRDLDQAREQLERLSDLGIDLDAVTDRLLEEGVLSFAESFEALQETIAEKRERLLSGWHPRSAQLGPVAEAVDRALEEMSEARILPRIWDGDHTVWSDDPEEIPDRLGWLHSVDVMADNLHRLEALAESAMGDGQTQALLLGMGGSSLAAQVLRETFGVSTGYLDLSILDSTDSTAIRAETARIDPARTLFLVSSKSGTTTETLSLFRHFHAHTVEAVGEKRAGDHFVAITDPGTPLADLAEKRGFRATFLNDPHIGGRYSALSYFGLVPAALIGAPIPELLDRAQEVVAACDSSIEAQDHPGAWLGAVIAESAKRGRDKLTLVTSPSVSRFADWVEQLIAESTGKAGVGVLPVVGEPLAQPEAYGEDRIFVQVALDREKGQEEALEALSQAGHPVVRLHLRDRLDLGGQFFLWEMATAVAGHRLGIHPFNQPDVEAAKSLAREMVSEFQAKGRLPDEAPALEDGGVEVYGQAEARDLDGALADFLGHADPGGYLAILVYLPPTEETTSALQRLRLQIRDRTGVATTWGYGPRYLHSTGQLHKGDAGRGVFLLLTAGHDQDLAIPDAAASGQSSLTFGILEAAQAAGDRKALDEAGRPVLRLHFGADVAGGLSRLLKLLSPS